jgi:hypothetical protein
LPGGLEGTAVLGPDVPFVVRVSDPDAPYKSIYKLERGRLLICVSRTCCLPSTFGVTAETDLLIFEPQPRTRPE